MTIISEENKILEKMKESNKIKNILKELNLPENYFIEDSRGPYFNIEIIKKYKILGFLPSMLKIATIVNFGEVIKIRFEDYDEYVNLKRYFEESTTKFEVIIEEEGVYY